MDEWTERTEGKRQVQRSVLSSDRDAPDTYVQIVEFPSHEAAMENSNMAETTEFAGRLAALCQGPPTFRNLDVRRIDQFA